jgi:hypothetical protein
MKLSNRNVSAVRHLIGGNRQPLGCGVGRVLSSGGVADARHAVGALDRVQVPGALTRQRPLRNESAGKADPLTLIRFRETPAIPCPRSAERAPPGPRAPLG